MDFHRSGRSSPTHRFTNTNIKYVRVEGSTWFVKECEVPAAFPVGRPEERRPSTPCGAGRVGGEATGGNSCGCRWSRDGRTVTPILLPFTRARTNLLICAYNHPRRAPTRAPPFMQKETRKEEEVQVRNPRPTVPCLHICARARCSRTFNQLIYAPAPAPATRTRTRNPHPHGPQPPVRPAPN